MWLLALPLVLGGSQAAHALDYWVVEPDAHARAHLLAVTGHSYFEYAPLVAAIAGAAAVLGLAGSVAGSLRGDNAAVPLRWPFALLPLAVFTFQEHLERLLHDGRFPWHLVLEPTFLLGVAFQLPFALVAYVLARLLLRAASELGRRLGRAAPRARVWLPRSVAAVGVVLPRRSPLADGFAVRGPPLRSLA